MTSSLSSTWDLQASSAPRSICIFPAPSVSNSSSSSRVSNQNHYNNGKINSNNPFEQRRLHGSNMNTSTNPFDNAARALTPSNNIENKYDSTAQYAVVIGTENGALHYRTYQKGNILAKSANDSSREPKIAPYGVNYNPGVSGSSGRPLPKAGNISHQPIDFSNAASGAVVGVIQGFHESHGSQFSNNHNQPTSFPFLLLVDDNRGSASSSSSAPGTYATSVVSLSLSSSSLSSTYSSNQNSNQFLKLNINLPRMSAAAFHPKCGFVYAAGSSIISLGISAMKDIYKASASASSTKQSYNSRNSNTNQSASLKHFPLPSIVYKCIDVLPSNIRSGGKDTLALVCQGNVAVVSVNNSFFAVASTSALSSYNGSMDNKQMGKRLTYFNTAVDQSVAAVELLTLNQSSIHPVIIMDINTNNVEKRNSAFSEDGSNISLLFLASNRECAIVEIKYSTTNVASRGKTTTSTAWKRNHPYISNSPPRNGVVTLPTAILAATSTLLPSSRTRHGYQKYNTNNQSRDRSKNNSSTPLLAILTSDGLLHIRSPSCLSVPLSIVKIGNSPNIFFAVNRLPTDVGLGDDNTNRSMKSKSAVVTVGYSGDAKVVICREEALSEQADRIMRLSIDAFGADNFPRADLAEAIKASFSATSHVGPEPTSHSQSVLRQYLEVALGLVEDTYDKNIVLPLSDVSTYDDVEDDPIIPRGTFDTLNLNDDKSMKYSDKNAKMKASSYYLTGTALLCLVCTQLSNASLANQAAKTCSSKTKIMSYSNYPQAVLGVCEFVADQLLNYSSKSISLIQKTSQKIESSHKNSQKETSIEFMEAALWLLRSCGKHEKAISILLEQKTKAQRNSTPTSYSNVSSLFSPIKYQSYTAAHLEELFQSNDENCTKLALQTSATRKLLEQNPCLGLSVFMSNHPRNNREWKDFVVHKDPLETKEMCILASMVVELLKSAEPRASQVSTPLTDDQGLDSNQSSDVNQSNIPLDSGRALAVTYLESAVGISTGKPLDDMGEMHALESLPTAAGLEEHVAGLHDELVYLLLEGVIVEMRGDEDESKGIGADVSDTKLGKVYRDKLRRMLSWPNAKYRADRILSSLPASFLQEQALLLGKLGQHDAALNILYCDLKNLGLALEYCDDRYERQLQQEKLQQKRDIRSGLNPSSKSEAKCAYLPLVKVALDSSTSSSRGTSAAIQVLALRRHRIDRVAALRLLPETLPMSAIARPFLIPALVDSESQVRRLTVTAALLRSKYISLKHALTEAQIKSQSDLASVPALQSLNLGAPYRSSKPFRALSSSGSSATVPDVTIIKHFFPNYVIIQVQVTNSSLAIQGRTLGDVEFVIAESSDEAILPSKTIPIQTLPYNATGCAWCVLAASPARLDGLAILTCELRYTVLSIDAATGAPLHFSGSGVGSKGRSYVEELQDVEVRNRDFDKNW